MLNFQYPSGHLGIYDAPRQTYLMHVLFFYDERISYEQMHLLEHLILNPQRILTGGKTLQDTLIETEEINGLATGNFLAFNVQCNMQDAELLTKTLLEILGSSPISTQATIENEINILHTENGHTHPLYPIFEHNTPNPFKIDNELIDITPEIIDDWFLYNIKTNRPCILIAGDTRNQCVEDAINMTHDWLLSEPKKISNREIFLNLKTPLGVKERFTNGLKEVNLFSCLPHEENIKYFHQTLLFFILQDIFFEQFRLKEKSDYQPMGLDRNTLYSEELVFSFYTHHNSQELIQKFETFFGKDQEYFEKKKKKIMNMILTREDSYTEYYQVAQIYFFTKEFKRAGYFAEQIEKITYGDFMEYYKRWFAHTSIYAVPN